MDISAKCVEAYRKHRHLKLAGEEVGIPWQTLYVHLKNAGEPVTGDKLKYGSEKDRLAAKAEELFLSIVPYATAMNESKFQAKYDFDVGGHKVEVKASRLARSVKGFKGKRYAFSLKKQHHMADFFVCFCLDDHGCSSALLIPGEIARNRQTISLPEKGGKWSDYKVTIGEIELFFSSMMKLAKH
jgi:hypothetical protein